MGGQRGCREEGSNPGKTKEGGRDEQAQGGEVAPACTPAPAPCQAHVVSPARCCCAGNMSETAAAKYDLWSPSAKGAMKGCTSATKTASAAVRRRMPDASTSRVGVLMISSADDRADLCPRRPERPRGCMQLRCAPALQECSQGRRPQQDADREEDTEFMAKKTEWGGRQPQADRGDRRPGLRGPRHRRRSRKPLHHRDETDLRVQSKTRRMSTTLPNRCHQQDLQSRSVSPTPRKNRRSY